MTIRRWLTPPRTDGCDLYGRRDLRISLLLEFRDFSLGRVEQTGRLRRRDELPNWCTVGRNVQPLLRRF